MDKTRLLYFALFGLLFPLVFSSVGVRNSHVAELTDNSGTLHKDGQMSWGRQSRLYYYYEPINPGPSPRPLVILLHGGGMNVESFLGSFSIESMAADILNQVLPSSILLWWK